MSVSRLIINISLVCLVILFLVLPSSYPFSRGLFSIIAIDYIICVYSFFAEKKKKNYFDFDTIFIFINSTMVLLLPLYYGTSIYDTLVAWGVGNIDNLLLKATVLEAVGVLAYLSGSLHKAQHPIMVKVWLYASNKVKVACFFCFLLCTLLFILNGGIEFYRSIYNIYLSQIVGKRIIFQMITLMSVFAIIHCSLTFYNNRKLTIFDFISFGIILIFCAQLAIVGNRTVFSIIILPYIFCYATYKHPLNLKMTAGILIIGVVCMYAIQIIRQGLTGFTTTFAVTFSDFTLPASTNASFLEYVDKFGFNFGKTFFTPLIGIVPGLDTLLGRTNEGAAELITEYLKHRSASDLPGMGCTCISDIYVSFGIIGVVLLMFFLGYIIRNLDRSNLSGRIVECSLFASCIFMCRSSYLMPCRYILWSLMFTMIFNILLSSKKI